MIASSSRFGLNSAQQCSPCGQIADGCGFTSHLSISRPFFNCQSSACHRSALRRPTTTTWLHSSPAVVCLGVATALFEHRWWICSNLCGVLRRVGSFGDEYQYVDALGTYSLHFRGGTMAGARVGAPTGCLGLFSVRIIWQCEW
jgi:hypothetical protein